MDWILRGPQFHSILGNLGTFKGKQYQPDKNCNVLLESILQSLISDDKSNLSYRRGIHFGRSISKNFFPILENTKDDKTVELLINIFIHLTIPIEYLASEINLQTDLGRQISFDLNSLLSSIKLAFTESSATKALIGFLNRNRINETGVKLSLSQCSNINITLTLFINVLNIQECIVRHHKIDSPYNIQRKIIWNSFSQNLDQVLLDLIISPQACEWAIAIMQLIVLFYKDQQASSMRKLLNEWLYSCISDTSEDNESNTSSPYRDLSPVPIQQVTNESFLKHNSPSQKPATDDFSTVQDNEMFSGKQKPKNNLDTLEPKQKMCILYKDMFEDVKKIGDQQCNVSIREHKTKMKNCTSGETNIRSIMPAEKSTGDKSGNLQQNILGDTFEKTILSMKRKETFRKSPVQNQQCDAQLISNMEHASKINESESVATDVESGLPMKSFVCKSSDPRQSVFEDSYKKIMIEMKRNDIEHKTFSNHICDNSMISSRQYETQNDDCSSVASDIERGSPKKRSFLNDSSILGQNDFGALCNKIKIKNKTTKIYENRNITDQSSNTTFFLNNEDETFNDDCVSLVSDIESGPPAKKLMFYKAVNFCQNAIEEPPKKTLIKMKGKGISKRASIKNQQCNVDRSPKCEYEKQNENSTPVATFIESDSSQNTSFEMPSKNNTAEMKKKKILKRESTNVINIKSLLHNLPSEEDISKVMKNFTIDFLLKGFNRLTESLYDKTVSSRLSQMDLTYFFWMTAYFLKFVNQIELGYKYVSSVISYNILTYLIKELFDLCETFEISINKKLNDLNSISGKMHLGVGAIKEYFKTLINVRKSCTCKDEKVLLSELITNICDNTEIRSLFVLLIRSYKAKYHSKQYLKDLIVTNHLVVTFVDGMSKSSDYQGTFDVVTHVKQFANKQMMFIYGLLLENFKTNDKSVNDSIFTIMFHVGGSLCSLQTLYQPHILLTFTSILEAKYNLSDDWLDFMDYTINSFVRKFGVDNDITDVKNILNKENFNIQSDEDIENCSTSSTTGTNKKCPEDSWSEDEITQLSYSYFKNNMSSDVVSEIIKVFEDDGITKTRSSIIDQLLAQNLINDDEYKDFIKNNDNAKQTQVNKEDETVSGLIGKICHNGKTEQLNWLRETLENCQLIKENFERILFPINENNDHSDHESPINLMPNCSSKRVKELHCVMTMSSVTYYSLVFNQQIPLVPWNHKQSSYFEESIFLKLLTKLGFLMPTNSGKIYIRIPDSWNATKIGHVLQSIPSAEGNG